MSNKPLTLPSPADEQTSNGYELHDASDPRCKNHDKAKRHKGIQPDLSRTCPTCNEDFGEPKPRRRRATRPASTKKGK